jgi:hypothetical protein
MITHIGRTLRDIEQLGNPSRQNLRLSWTSWKGSDTRDSSSCENSVPFETRRPEAYFSPGKRARSQLSHSSSDS